MKPLFYHYSIFFSYMRIFYGKVCKKFLFVMETILQKKKVLPAVTADSTLQAQMYALRSTHAVLGKNGSEFRIFMQILL